MILTSKRTYAPVLITSRYLISLPGKFLFPG